jgi:Zn-dependent M16 (insulinase) family peptidase
MREEILATSSADFTRFADLLVQVNSQGSVVVLGSQDAIEKANAARGNNWLRTLKVL